MKELFLFLFSYIVGSIPFGWIISKIKGIDITKLGSGNIGATNVFRILGKKYGLTVLFLDLLKGYLPTITAVLLTNNDVVVVGCAFLAILGHMFSPFLKFKGGKGVATGLGIFLALSPKIFLMSFSIGLLIIVLTRYVSLGSISGSILLTILMYKTNQPLPYSIMASVATAFILIKHIQNIKRLINGTENKISWKN